MLLSNKCLAIGLELLLVSHIANTYVMLTAGIEDVRKLARKYVSESLADQIAEFLGKLSGTNTAPLDISKENDANIAKIHKVSGEVALDKFDEIRNMVTKEKSDGHKESTPDNNRKNAGFNSEKGEKLESYSIETHRDAYPHIARKSRHRHAKAASTSSTSEESDFSNEEGGGTHKIHLVKPASETTTSALASINQILNRYLINLKAGKTKEGKNISPERPDPPVTVGPSRRNLEDDISLALKETIKMLAQKITEDPDDVTKVTVKDLKEINLETFNNKPYWDTKVRRHEGAESFENVFMG